MGQSAERLCSALVGVWVCLSMHAHARERKRTERKKEKKKNRRYKGVTGCACTLHSDKDRG